MTRSSFFEDSLNKAFSLRPHSSLLRLPDTEHLEADADRSKDEETAKFRITVDGETFEMSTIPGTAVSAASFERELASQRAMKVLRQRHRWDPNFDEDIARAEVEDRAEKMNIGGRARAKSSMIEAERERVKHVASLSRETVETDETEIMKGSMMEEGPKKLNGYEEETRYHELTPEEETEQLLRAAERDSPYAEVRAAVRAYDEDVPCCTLRAWVIGLFLVTLGSFMNMLFQLRAPTISVGSFVAQLVAYPLGKGWERFGPWALQPSRGDGRFNVKEHALIVIMANISFGQGAAYATDTIVVMKAKSFYGIGCNWALQLLLSISTQMVGYGLAGLLRRFLVWPASMIWPSTFINTSLFYALHDKSDTSPSKANGWSISRYRFFMYVFIGSFVWYWIPGWLFQGLSLFSFVTWIKPENPVINQLFGYSTGLGILPITFDWTQVTAYTTSPLMFPWHAIANTMVGIVIFFLALGCGLHYSNWAWGLYLPISTNAVYDNQGGYYNVSRVVNGTDLSFDEKAYQAYSPIFMPTMFAVAYGLAFASVAALVTHTIIYHGKEILARCRLSLHEDPDIHLKLMRRYFEVPWWWYAILLAVTMASSFAAVVAFPTTLPWWGLILALVISVIFFIPIGMIQATTNIQLGTNVAAEALVGHILPGRPLAMMLFKTYAYIPLFQGLNFAQDLKLGHYLKIPPRSLFAAQIVASAWSLAVQLTTLNFLLDAVPDLCSATQTHGYTCPGPRTFFNASLLWGVLGPSRVFGTGHGSAYALLVKIFVPLGLLLPPALYCAARFAPLPRRLRRVVALANAPVLLGGSGAIPPAQLVNYSAWGLVGFVFNKLLKDRRRGWWSAYNYVASAALDSGLAIATVAVFLSLQLPGFEPPSWWGNDVVKGTMDWRDAAVVRTVGPGEFFGPTSW